MDRYYTKNTYKNCKHKTIGMQPIGVCKTYKKYLLENVLKNIVLPI